MILILLMTRQNYHLYLLEIFTYAYEGCAYSDSTDSNGIVIFEDIPWSEYNVNINSEIFVDYGSFIDTMPIVAAKIYNPDSSINTIDTVNILCGGSEKGLKINEIYSVGPPNKLFFIFLLFQFLILNQKK